MNEVPIGKYIFIYRKLSGQNMVLPSKRFNMHDIIYVLFMVCDPATPVEHHFFDGNFCQLRYRKIQDLTLSSSHCHSFPFNKFYQLLQMWSHFFRFPPIKHALSLHLLPQKRKKERDRKIDTHFRPVCLYASVCEKNTPTFCVIVIFIKITLPVYHHLLA